MMIDERLDRSAAVIAAEFGGDRAAARAWLVEHGPCAYWPARAAEVTKAISRHQGWGAARDWLRAVWENSLSENFPDVATIPAQLRGDGELTMECASRRNHRNMALSVVGGWGTLLTLQLCAVCQLHTADGPTDCPRCGADWYGGDGGGDFGPHGTDFEGRTW